MSRAPTIVLATSASGAVAVVALAVLLLATLLSSSGLGRVGLGLLFSVPLVRNAVVVGRGRGFERLLAVLGIALVVVVGAISFSSVDTP